MSFDGYPPPNNHSLPGRIDLPNVDRQKSQIDLPSIDRQRGRINYHKSEYFPEENYHPENKNRYQHRSHDQNMKIADDSQKNESHGLLDRYFTNSSDNILADNNLGNNSNIQPIPVYLLMDDTKKEKSRLVNFFENPLFDLRITNLPPPATLTVGRGLTKEQAIEIYRFTKVLKKARKSHPHQFVLVLKDTSVGTSTPEQLESLLREAESLYGWDICYLTRWLDRCDLYQNPIPIKSSMKALVKTFSPNGTQAFYFSPEGRDIILGKRKMKNGKYFTPIEISLGTKLNQEISQNNISAICSVPNEFEFDVLQARRISDLAKLSDCRRPETIEPGPGPIPFVWFLAIVVGIILIAWALYALGPTYHGISKLRPK